MSYAIYKTDAIIMRLIPSSEASIDAVLFTRAFGKITVRVQSARKHESKMRMFLTRFRLVTVDLVRGKSLWRLTGITGEPISTALKDEALMRPLYRMSRLAEFLVQGESPHVELFDFFKNALHAKKEYGYYSVGLEIYYAVKVLDFLGYWSGDLFPGQPTVVLLEECSFNKKKLIKKINESISASQIMIY